jgi:hypothetical protein
LSKFNDISLRQAQELADRVLGEEWTALEASREGFVALFDDEDNEYKGKNWHEAFAEAGVTIPQKPTHARFVAIGPRVMLAAQACCTAVSNTMAKRIANALNAYIPASRRGK